jgi:transcriptional regulator with XRE-family HTH domain
MSFSPTQNGDAIMFSSPYEELVEQFRDKEYREAYADDFLDAYIAAQIRTIREQRDMTQQELADLIGTKQTGISRIENVNYSSWNIRTLKKIAYALGGRLHVSIETFGSLVEEGASFSRKALQRPSVQDDPVLKQSAKLPKSEPPSSNSSRQLPRPKLTVIQGGGNLGVNKPAPIPDVPLPKADAA